jgi:AAA+ superfamily predicted ATPase
MILEKELDVYLRARITLIVIVSSEEERVLQAVKAVSERLSRPCLAWDMGDQFQSITEENGKLPAAKEPLTALQKIDDAEDEGIFVLKDFHEWWGQAPIKRMLRNLGQRLRFTKKTIIITSPVAKLPEELKDEAVVLSLPAPDAAELEAVLTRLTRAPGVRVNLTSFGREKLVQAALGLTAAQAHRVFAKAIVGDGVLDDRGIDLVTQEKRHIIRENKALEYYPVISSPDEVGGLDLLKDWLRLRERAFTQEARNYGLPFPKGIALIGIPGTGKSLTAKMIGGLWRLPLIRLDVGSLFGSLMGESEERARSALQLAETVAPCIVWIDEMEKALSHGDLDSGTSTRVFGTILTWMQEKRVPCFVVATANDITSLPPELLRKGRFDEIFFLDLPTLAEREAILAVHLSKRNRVPGDYDISRLARESEGYVGAEIEQAIIDAMYVGFNAGREFNTEDISFSLKRQIPLAVSQRETVESLRRWLQEGRAQSASAPDIRSSPSSVDILSSTFVKRG